MATPGNLGVWWSILGGSPRALVRAAAFVVLLVVALMAAEIPFVPWARSFGLWPTLTGSWFGASSSTAGNGAFVYLELTGGMSSGSRRQPFMGGRAKWCGPGNTIHDYDLFGEPDNWRGTRFHLEARNVVEQPFGPVLSQLRGQWNRDEINAEGVVIVRTSAASATATRGAVTTTPSPTVVHYVLRRGHEHDFVAACQQDSRSRG
jgi:hypothetical protein